MRGLPVTEFPKVYKHPTPSNLVTTEKNRLISWDSTVQGLTKPLAEIPRPKNPDTPKPLGFVSKITKLIFTSLAKLPYTLFKLGYEIAKFVTRGLSSIRRSLFVAE
jgi:hypothetical protein